MLKTCLFLIALSFFSCGVKNTPMRTTPPAATQAIFVDPSINPETGIDPFQIKDAQQIGDYIVMDVSYSGGCEEHIFKLETKGDFTSTYPPELDVTLKHNSNNDRCRGIIDKKLWFDLRPIQFEGTNRVLMIITNSETTLEYNY